MTDQNPQSSMDEDCLESIADQVTDLVCPLTLAELERVFEHVRAQVAQFQAQVEDKRTDQIGKLQRLLED